MDKEQYELDRQVYGHELAEKLHESDQYSTPSERKYEELETVWLVTKGLKGAGRQIGDRIDDPIDPDPEDRDDYDLDFDEDS